MSFSTRRLTTVFVAILAAACAAKPAGPLRLVFSSPRVDREGQQKVEPPVGELRFSAPIARLSEIEAEARPGPFVVSLRIVEGAERASFVRDRLDAVADPFASVDAHSPIVTILMSVRNDGDEPLTFNPQGIVLFTDRPTLLPPLDATRAYEEFRAAGLDPDPWMPHLHRVVFDTAVTLKPTEEISRLLAFPHPDPEVDRARLQFAFWAMGMASYSFELPMEQVPVEPSGTNGDGPA